MYAPDMVGRIKQIHALKEKRFTLDEIRKISDTCLTSQTTIA